MPARVVVHAPGEEPREVEVPAEGSVEVLPGLRAAAAELAGVFDQLLDREWPDEKRQAFVEAAARHPELSNLHDLRTRTSGAHDFVQFHVDLPSAMTVAAAHDIIERVETDLMRQFPNMELLIHIDPEGHVDEPGNALVEEDEFSRLERDA